MIVQPPRVPDVQKPSIFLAGGISNCPDWQTELCKEIQSENNGIQVFNPRWDYKWTALEQIEWEFKYLREVDVISFWFSKGTLNPIVLYELGMWGNSTGRPICVGIHPDYERILDVVVQTKLARPEISIVYSIEELAGKVFGEIDNLGR